MMKTINLSNTPRILVTRTDRIGDLVLTTPLFKALREKFQKAWIAAVVFLEHREIVLGNPYLDEVILFCDTMNGLMAAPNLIALIVLAPTVRKLTHTYFSQRAAR